MTYVCVEHSFRYSLDDLNAIDYNGEDYHFQNQCPYKCEFCDNEAKYKVIDDSV